MRISDLSSDVCSSDLREFVADRLKLFPHDCVEFHAVAQNCEIFRDIIGKPLQLIPNFVAAKRGQTVEAQVQYGPYLKVAELVGFAFDFMLDGLDQPDERRNFRYRSEEHTSELQSL